MSKKRGAEIGRRTTESADLSDAPDRLVPVEVTSRDLKTGRLVQVGVTVRRRGEAALAAFLADNPNHEKAAARIVAAYSLIDRGLGVQESAIARAMRGGTAGSAPEPARLDGLLADYFRWSARCGLRGIDDQAIVDVLGRGYSLREVERARRRRNGWLAEEMRRGLDVYAELRGWQRGTQAALDGINSP